jgi:hypothetical protein
MSVYCPLTVNFRAAKWQWNQLNYLSRSLNFIIMISAHKLYNSQLSVLIYHSQVIVCELNLKLSLQ